MIRKELRKVLAGEGVTEEEVIRMYRQAFTKADETDNASAMRSVAKDLGEMLAMKPDRQSFSQQSFEEVDFSQLLTEYDQEPDLLSYDPSRDRLEE